jgi:hypothetical protein
MSNREIQDLVDSYLLHQINAEDKARLLDMMEADPVFAQSVKESEETFKVLQLARNRELRAKLKTWDAAAEQPKRGRSKGLLFFFLCVFLFISFWCWISYHFSPVTMAMHSFNAIPEFDIQITDHMTSVDYWQEGMDAFRQEDFENAMLEFMSIPQTNDQTVTAHVRWNVLLCQLALNGPTHEWIAELNGFSKNAPEPIRTEAMKLLHVIQSPLYTNLYRGVFQKTITSVKPKII